MPIESSSESKTKKKTALTDQGWPVRAITDIERQTVEVRQLRHQAAQMVAVPTLTACHFGFPQAVLWEPVGGRQPNSGLGRLTCPHLMKV
jgi:hypothetical protein